PSIFQFFFLIAALNFAERAELAVDFLALSADSAFSAFSAVNAFDLGFRPSPDGLIFPSRDCAPLTLFPALFGFPAPSALRVFDFLRSATAIASCSHAFFDDREDAAAGRLLCHSGAPSSAAI